MPPVLRCPECGHRHPAATVPDADTFRCQSCGRALKVPTRLRELVTTGSHAAIKTEAEPADTAAARPIGDSDHRSRSRGAELLPPLERRRDTPRLRPLGIGWRLLIWIVAMPVGAAIGAVVADAFGLITAEQLEDAFLDTGLARFAPLARLVPIWALATALFVTGVVGLTEAWRRRRYARRVEAESAPVSSPGPNGSVADAQLHAQPHAQPRRTEAVADSVVSSEADADPAEDSDADGSDGDPGRDASARAETDTAPTPIGSPEPGSGAAARDDLGE